MRLRPLATVLLLAAAAPARAAVLDAFQYADDRALAAAWRAADGTPAARRTDDGVELRCLFDDGRDRAYWDRTVALDLRAITGFEIELSCDRPEALRAFMLYFKSGGGWYVASKPLQGAGRQRLSFSKQDFTVEGRPIGWQAIERIRLSAWRGSPVSARLVAHALAGRMDPLLVIRSDVSAPNATERAVAERAADRVGRWLNGAGVPHAVLPEKDLSADKLDGCRVLILPYNARPAAAHLALYRRHVESGGKLIVCYSESGELAELMGVALGEAISHREPGRWAGFKFEGAADLPDTVYQQSWGLRLARPLAGRGRVIAHWINAAGGKQPEPAWIETDRGYWMTHIPLDDDREGKEQLMLGLIGALDPTAWREAARHAVSVCGKIDGFGGWPDSLRGIRALAAGHPSRAGIEALLDQAEAEHQVLMTHYSSGRFPPAVRQARAIRALLGQAYSRAQRPPDREFRAVWEHDGVGWYPGDWDRTMRELSSAGFNAVFVNTLWGGLAHYPSKIVPESHTFRRHGDQMRAALEAGRRHGVEVHAWVVLWQAANSTPDFLARMRKAGRLQQDFDGSEIAWLNPAMPENQAHMAAAIEELAGNYDVAGIHLDYVRYPSARACAAPASRRIFEGWLGRSLRPWPGAVRLGGGQTEFRRWRAGLLTEFVRTVRARTRGIRREMKLSAAVWGGYPDTIASIGQDWGLWLREGLLDFACPMNYSEDAYKFSALTAKQLALPDAGGRIYPGIGVTAAESQLRADQVVEQIAIARRLGAPGFALYDMSQTLRRETLPMLRQGATPPIPHPQSALLPGGRAVSSM